MTDEQKARIEGMLLVSAKTIRSSFNDEENLYQRAYDYIAELKSENAELRARLDKAVELKVKVGDTIYMPWIWNGNSGIAGLIVREIQTVGDGVTYYITSFTTDDLAFAAHYKFGKFEEYYFGNMVFTTREAAEARLAEMKGEAK